MNNWKHYAGSVLLAGLLLQGCSSDTTEDTPVVAETEAQKAARIAKADANEILAFSDNADDTRALKLALSSPGLETSDSAEDFVKNALAQLVEDGVATQEEVDTFIAEHDLNQEFLAALKTLGAKKSAHRSIFSSIGDKIKDGLVDILDSSVGDSITGAAFDVVLNSEGVTVFMLDLARGSQTITDVMINALDENWELTEKMCPMLQENAEFGEKFVALADERDNLGRFFFEKIDGRMYGCLTDAMILSADEDVHHESVSHSTNGYMGVLLEKYAVDYFIEPGTGTSTYTGGSTDKFAGLMFTTGDVITVDGNTTSGHGDANELANEQFFYAMFRAPYTTDAFVASMESVKTADAANVTMFMDQIFLGEQNTTAFGAGSDTVQGYYNIISIAGGMYEGINNPRYGFSSYSSAFVGFAGLIPTDRYLTYGSAFMNAGFFWAEQNGISVWGAVSDAAKEYYYAWTDSDSTIAVEEAAAAAGAPARSGGNGLISSSWISDSLDVVYAAWDNIDIEIYPEATYFEYYNNQAMIAYNTVIDGREDLVAMYPTTLENSGETVYGFHGLIELAVREDMVTTGAFTQEEADAFALPLFSELTWDFAYNSAATGVTAYWDNVVNAQWLADLSTNALVVEYFYPDADNAYIPSWLLAIDWLKAPVNVDNASYADIDIDFDSGFVDVYLVSTNADLINDADFATVAALVKDNVTFEAITSESDSIIVVDANGQDMENGLYVYKLRMVNPDDVAAVLTALGELGDSVLNAVGIDTDNAADTVTTEEEA